MFSELTLFLFGSGLAFFIALLGWSEQIRSTGKETREVEAKFLQKHKIEKSELLRIVRATNPEEQLEALTQLMTSGKLKTVPDVEVLGMFERWNRMLSKLEKYYTYKYDLTIVLTICMFLSGIGSLFTHPQDRLSLLCVVAPVELLLLLVPVALIAAILVIVILANAEERSFRGLLVSISDRV